MPTARELLDIPSSEPIEKWGQLQATDLQISIVRAALEHPDDEPEELAERLSDDEIDTSSIYVMKVLSRADDEFIDEHVGGRETTNGHPTMNEAISGDARDAVTVTFVIPGIGELAEVTTAEWCEECSEFRDVNLLVPTDSAYYMKPKVCGHPGNFRDDVPEGVEWIRRARQAIEEMTRENADENGNEIDAAEIVNELP